MPLLRQAGFVKKKVPKNLKDDVPLYLLDVTGEVFTEYDEFCYRIIQCNSLVWTCEETGRTDLTYAEARESEQDAQKILAVFPQELKISALYLASLTRSMEFVEMVTDIYNFMKDRFFVGEIVAAKSETKWECGKIIKVSNPKAERMQATKKSVKDLEHCTPPDWYVYDVKPYADGKSLPVKKLNGAKLCRPRDSCLNVPSLSAFLKPCVDLNSSGIWEVKADVLHSFGIKNVRFQHIFCGDPPVLSEVPRVKNLDRPQKSSEKTPPGTKNERRTGHIVTKSRSKILDNYESTESQSEKETDETGPKSPNKSVNFEATKQLSAKKNHSETRAQSRKVDEYVVSKKTSVKKSGKEGVQNSNKVLSKQQNIEKYFSSSKKPSNDEILKIVHDVQKTVEPEGTEPNEPVPFETQSIHSDVSEINEEDNREIDVRVLEGKINTEPDSDSSAIELLQNSEGDSDSSVDEIKVVWASTVKPHRPDVENIYENISKYVVDTGSGPVLVKEEKFDDDKKPAKNKHGKDREKDETDTLQTGQKKYATDSQAHKRPSNQKSVPVESPKHPDPKKMKQTDMAHLLKSPQTGSLGVAKTKKSVSVSSQKGGKKDKILRKKQKVVGTLKPWVQSTKKNDWQSVPSTSKAQSLTARPKPTSKEKKKNWLEVQREIEIREKQRKEDEKQRKKQKKVEQKLKFAKFMKEWQKPREDLLCEDMKPLPVPCEVNCQIPNEMFGEFMVIFEFLHSFQSTLRTWTNFTGCISFDCLERAVTEKEIGGPLFEIIRVLLTVIFNLQKEENEIPTSGVPIAVDLNLDELCENSVTPQEAVPQAAAASGWSDLFQGLPLHAISLNVNTITEVLRLHLLGSGGRECDSNSKWLYLRGGYSSLEDPGLYFRIEKPSILLNLSLNHVSELSIKDKIEIISCLVNQVLTFGHMREIIDERSYRAREAKAAVKSLQVTELKLLKEAATKRVQEKKEAKLSLSKGLPNTVSEHSFLAKQKMEKELNKVKSDLQKKSTRVLPLVLSHQLLPLGCDRAHRRYWVFSSVSGLFIEWNPFEIGPCLPQPTPQTVELSDTLTHVRRLFEEEEGQNSSDKENDSFEDNVTKSQSGSPKKKLLLQNNPDKSYSGVRQEDNQAEYEPRALDTELLVCTASDNCPVHCRNISTNQWSFLAKPEDLSALLGALNERGIRESALKTALMQDEQRIMEGITQCPRHILNSVKFVDSEPRKSSRLSPGYKSESVLANFSPDTPIKYVMEWTLRENILNLEDKIMTGGIGSLKVKDRTAWRLAIKNGKYDLQCKRLVWGFRLRSTGKKRRIDADELEDIPNDGTQEEIDKEEDSSDKVSLREEQVFSQKDESNSSRRDDSIIEERSHIARKYSDGNGDIKNEKVDTVSDTCNKVLTAIVTPNNATREGKPACSCSKEQCVCGKEDSDSMCVDISDGTLSSSDLPEPENRINEKRRSEKSGKNASPSPKNPKEESRAEPVSSDSFEAEAYYGSVPPQDPVIKDLACAILQLAQSFKPEYLKKPLVDLDGTKTRMKYWEVSLMNAINFSQLYIHQSTLEKSINWSKSLFNAPCVKCRKRVNGKKIIRCTGCSKRYHIYCVKPRLKAMPEGEWLCPHCAPVEEPANETLELGSERVRSTARKRKRNQSDNESNEDNTSLSERIKQIKFHKSQCIKCHKSGNLVFCTVCSSGYHPDCIDSSPQQRHQPKDWKCKTCRNGIKSQGVKDSCKMRESSSELSTGYGDEEPSDDGCREIKTKENDYSEDDERTTDLETLPPAESRNDSDYLEDDQETTDMDSFPNSDGESSSARDTPTRGKSAYARKQRGSASAARAKIASFTRKLKSESWDDDSEKESPRNVANVPSGSYETASASSSANTDGTFVRRSGRRGLYVSEDLPLDNAILDTLLTEMIRHPDSWLFLKPVSRTKVPDYHRIIKKPIDLGTIKCKLNTALYSSNKEFLADISLMFENCFMYNDAESLEFKSGRNLHKHFQTRCEELGLNVLHW